MSAPASSTESLAGSTATPTIDSSLDGTPHTNKQRPFRIRTITAFVTLHANDFYCHNLPDDKTSTFAAAKIDKCNTLLRTLEKNLTGAGYEVQTVRVATNPFGEWLTRCIENDAEDEDEKTPLQKKSKTNTNNGTTTTMASNEISMDVIQQRINHLDTVLNEKDIHFCSLGPSRDPQHTTQICPTIVATSGKFSCSANIDAGDIDAARAAAKCMHKISTLGDDNSNEKVRGDRSHLAGGLGNFRFCAASCVETVPFFPGAKAPSNPDHSISFAIGLENGGFACELLGEAKKIRNIKNTFDTKMKEQLVPIQDICLDYVNATNNISTAADYYPIKYLGIDTSLNPSLDEGGSVADAIESLEEVRGDFGGTGSMAAAAAITTSLQSIPEILTTGYSGLMLPVLEDRRLSELGMASSTGDSAKDRLTIQKLLCISSVCGVGIDTVPIPSNVSEESLSSLILDVAALAGRWNKPLSCRVFPVPGGKAGEETTFDSPYMCNSCIFDL
ncbi:hypothetical protein ACHAXR_009045 [Thalassiosira sp. AJA248-18]